MVKASGSSTSPARRTSPAGPSGAARLRRAPLPHEGHQAPLAPPVRFPELLVRDVLDLLPDFGSSERSRQSGCKILVVERRQVAVKPGGRWTPFVTEVIGTSQTGSCGQRSSHISCETRRCSRLTAFRYEEVLWPESPSRTARRDRSDCGGPGTEADRTRSRFLAVFVEVVVHHARRRTDRCPPAPGYAW